MSPLRRRVVGCLLGVSLTGLIPAVVIASPGSTGQVLASTIGNYGPAWSPNGRKIAFGSYAPGRPQIYVIDAAGRRVRRVTHDGGSDFIPSWLPGGNRIAYLSGSPDDNAVTVVDTRGRNRATVLFGVNTVDWSPDGKRIVFDRNDPSIPQYQVWVMNADGRDRHMIVANGGHDGGDPTWSPDGKKIAFVGGANRDYATIDVIGADGHGRVRLTHGGNEHNPDWSPDGKQIVFGVGPHPHWHLAVVNADGSGEHALTASKPWDDTLPAWSPDGKKIAFTSGRTGNDEIWVVNADGTHLRRVTYGGCTIIGTAGDDVLQGTPGRDVICGLGGNDTIRGGEGDDRLLGGAGDDRIYGGPGNDIIFGQAGNDLLVGGPGSDRIDGGGGNDTIVARDGAHDRIEGGLGIDRAAGDAADFAYDVERGNLFDHRHPAQPTRAQIVSRTTAAVKKSRAMLIGLTVIVPRIRYTLIVRVADPAAYLEHRVNILVDVIRRLAMQPRLPFKRFRFAVENRSGQTIFSYEESRGSGEVTIGSAADPKYAGCTTGIDLDLGERSGTPHACPVR
jgi:Ca2+-binding RTX toxin-like protein